MAAELRITGELHDLPAIRIFLQTELTGMKHPQLSIQVIDSVLMATVEAVTNIIKYAYLHATDRALSIQLTVQDDILSVIIRHHGDLAIPEKADEPDFSGMSEDGFGIFIMNELMDLITYSQEEPDWQIICMTKYLL